MLMHREWLTMRMLPVPTHLEMAHLVDISEGHSRRQWRQPDLPVPEAPLSSEPLQSPDASHYLQ